MPKKRTRVRNGNRDVGHIDNIKKKRKKRERQIRRRLRILRQRLTERMNRLRKHEIELRTIDKYRIWYEHYRNIKFKVITRKFYHVVPKAKVPDYTSRVEALLSYISSLPQRFTRFLREFTLELMKHLIDYSPIGTARQLYNAYRLYKVYRGIRKSSMYAPIITIWKDRFLEVHIDRHIEEWLRDPQRFPAVIELLGTISRQLLLSKRELIIPPEQLEIWNSVIKILFEYYVSYARRMPCKRTQMMLRLTPVTMHVMRGLGVRMYVVRWLRRDNMSSPLLYADRPIDIHFRALMKYKYYGDIMSSMIVGGDTDRLNESDEVPTWRDARGLPRDMIKAINAFYQWWKFTDGLARSIGRPEMADALGDCSIYIRFKPPKNWLKRSERRKEYEYWKTYRWD